MISNEQLEQVIGKDVVDATGSKVGSARQVYLDDTTGQPAWVTVRTGLFGSSESFVPLSEASMDGGQLRVPYLTDQIKDAPRVDDDGHLSPEQEAELYRYYGLGEAEGTQRSQRSQQSSWFGTGAGGVREDAGTGPRATTPRVRRRTRR